MKIALSEIWNFIDLIGKEEKGWNYALYAGNVRLSPISQDVLVQLKSDTAYNTELLPEIFTFREILWQPDVFTDSAMSLPGLRILKAYCEEYVAQFSEDPTESNRIYSSLIGGLAQNCGEAISKMEGTTREGLVTRVLGEFRTYSFPIIKFFIYHPQNRIDYYRDAVNRLNYAVKVMLTQFYGRYTELNDPYWLVSYQEKKTPIKIPVTE